MPLYTSIAATRKYRTRYPAQVTAVVRYEAQSPLPEDEVCAALSIHMAACLVIEALAGGGNGQDLVSASIAEGYAANRKRRAEQQIKDMGIDLIIVTPEQGARLAEVDRAIAAAICSEAMTEAVDDAVSKAYTVRQA